MFYSFTVPNLLQFMLYSYVLNCWPSLPVTSGKPGKPSLAKVVPSSDLRGLVSSADLVRFVTLNAPGDS